MRPIRMLDLHGEYDIFRNEVRSAVEKVLESQQFIGGPAIGELEDAVSTRFGGGTAVAVSSGTDALLCAMMALGLGAGDEVIVPPFTFFATAGCVWRTGARPVFVDIDKRTFNLDPSKIEALITPRTKAIVAVHLFGQCAEMDTINEIAAKHKLAVIEDAAQAIGATYRGRPAGTLGDVACFSFYPTKNLGGFGEGGLIFTRNDQLAARVRQMRQHGESRRYIHEFVGGNFRLDTMKAAILLVKLGHLDSFTKKRQANAAHYHTLLADSPVTTPYVTDHMTHVYHQYSILTDRRDELQAALSEQNIGSGIYYPVPLHLQPCFASLGYEPGSLPVSEEICERILSLPCHPMLAEDDLGRVAECIGAFHAAATTSTGE